MLHNDNLENGMLRYQEEEERPEKLCDCAWCGGPIYIGDEYYDLAGESVCGACTENGKRRAKGI